MADENKGAQGGAPANTAEEKSETDDTKTEEETPQEESDAETTDTGKDATGQPNPPQAPKPENEPNESPAGASPKFTDAEIFNITVSTVLTLIEGNVGGAMDSAFDKNGIPLTSYLNSVLRFEVGDTLRDNAFAKAQEIISQSHKRMPSEPQSEASLPMKVIVEENGEKIQYDRNMFLEIGHGYRENNQKISRMWVHRQTGIKYFEDVPELKGKPIYPFLRKS